MTRTTPLLAIVFTLPLTSTLLGCGDDGTDSPLDAPVASVDASGTTDAPGPTIDAPVADDDAAAIPIDAAAPTCGNAMPPLAQITGTEGIAIGSDGTIYYSQSGGAVGRWVPGTVTPDDNWVDFGVGVGTIWGMAINDAGELFVASPDNSTIYLIDTSEANPAAEVLTDDAGSPNGLTLAGNGDVIWSHFADDGLVYRVSRDGLLDVSSTGFPRPNGVLFDGDGTLLVAEYSTGVISALTLDGDLHETDRVARGSIDGNPDGLARDALGRYYITDNSGGRVLRVDATFDNEEVLLQGVGSAANMAFGRGVLSCEDLFVTSSGALRRIAVGATGTP